MRALATALLMWVALGAHARAQALGEDEERRTLVTADLAVGTRQWGGGFDPVEHAAELVPTLFARTRVVGLELRPETAGARVDIDLRARGFAGESVDGAMRASPGNPELAARVGGRLGEGWLWLRFGLTVPVSAALSWSISRPRVERFAIAPGAGLDPQLVLTSTMGPSLALVGSHRGDWHYVSFEFALSFAFPTSGPYGTTSAGHTGFVLALHHWGVTLGLRVTGAGILQAGIGRPGLLTAGLQPFLRYDFGAPFLELYGLWQIGEPYGIAAGSMITTLGCAMGVAIW